MKINHLKLDFGYNGKTIVETWMTCHTYDDVDTLIAWLQMAKGTMRQWERINAKASRAAEAAAGKNETAKPREVQG